MNLFPTSFRTTFSLTIAAGILLSSSGQAADARTGVVRGLAVNSANGAPLPGVTVNVGGTLLMTSTDLDGGFLFQKVPEGTYELKAEKIGFQPFNVTGVSVENGATARVDLPLVGAKEQVVKMQAFSVSADVVQNSGIGLLIGRQRAVAVMDGLAFEEMARLSVSNAAEALAKMPGTTFLDGKYVVVRGLGDRYTNTQMNGATLPSADPDKRSVQLDQFPQDLLDSVTTLKSFTPDQPGAFSGGSVNIKTKSFPDSFFFSAGVSTAYSSATGKEILVVPGGGRDWQGRDDGTRQLSAAVPNPMPSNLTTTTAQLFARQGDLAPARQLDAMSRGFHNTPFFPRGRKAPADFGFNLSMGDSRRFGLEQVVGYVASMTWDRSSDHVQDGITGRYSQGSVDPANPNFVDVSRVFTTDAEAYKFADLYRAQPNVPGGTPAFGVTRSSENVEWGAYLQVAWRLSFRHEVAATLFHNQSAQDQVKRGIGEAVRSDSGGEFRENYDLLYTERGATSLQLAGKNSFPDWNDARLEWRASRSRSTQDQPDYRSLEFKWSFVLQDWDPSGLNNYRYFRALQENSTEYAVDFSRTFNLAGGREFTVKVGGAQFVGDRTNRERAFVMQSPNARTREGIESFPGAVGLTAQTANSVTFGTVMREISANLNYDGDQTFSAGYLMGDLRLTDRWRVIGGARFETTEITTTPLPTAGLTVRPGEVRQDDVLPALALVWSLSQQQNLRLSYGRTLARPTFRELADVVNYEAFTDDFIGGNPELEMTIIDNLDLRWEWFPRRGEVVAVSAFGKKLDLPIEQVFNSGRIFPNNVSRGAVYGLEFEARHRLNFLHARLESLTVGLNASLIKSEVDISPGELALIRAVFPGAPATRELYGQSPYIVNVDATWRSPSWGSSVTAVFGVSGRRLDLVTTGGLPDVYEQPAPALDLSWSQTLSARWRCKLTAKNLLDAERRKTLEHGGTTYYYDRHQRGRKYSLSLSYSFN